MRVLVVQGGPSTEAHVSRASGAAVLEALGRAGHDAHAAELDASLPEAIGAVAPDVIFPVTHGELGEDGCLQGLLEVLGVPYVGSGVRASAVAADKAASKVFFERAGLPLARQSLLRRAEDAALEPSLLRARLEAELGAEFVIKPVSGGSTIGISRVLTGTSAEEFRRALEVAFELDETVLVEAYHRGQEVTCGVLEDEAGVPRALPPTLIHAEATDWYDFTSKYKAGGSRHECPAPLPAETIERIQSAAVTAHRALGARDLSRTDFIVSSDGSFVVLELNNLPGMTAVSLFPEAAAAAGLSFPTLLDGLVRRAAARRGARQSRGAALPT